MAPPDLPPPTEQPRLSHILTVIQIIHAAVSSFGNPTSRYLHLKKPPVHSPPIARDVRNAHDPVNRTMQLTAIVRRHTPCSCRCIGRLVPSPRRLRHLQNDAGYKPLHDNSAVVKRPYRLEMSRLLQAPSTRTLRIPMRTRVGPTPSFTSASRAKSLFRL